MPLRRCAESTFIVTPWEGLLEGAGAGCIVGIVEYSVIVVLDMLHFR
jgi:hypothetical protein